MPGRAGFEPVSSVEIVQGGNDPVRSRRPLGAPRTWMTLLFVGIVPGAIALLARANLFPLMSGNSDEPVYVYQARMLAQGHVTLASRLHAEFFHPWLFGQRGGHLF